MDAYNANSYSAVLDSQLHNLKKSQYLTLGHAEKIWITVSPKTTKQTHMFMKQTIWKKSIL